jgi:hypothetical protein
VPGVTIKESEGAILLPTGSIIELESGENADRLRGRGYNGGVIDEVANIDGDKWRNAIRPTLSDKLFHGRPAFCLFIGTPGGGHDLFRELWLYSQSGDPDWAGMLVDTYEAGRLSTAEIEAARRELGDNAFRREYLVDFEAEGDDVLIPLSAATAAMKRAVGAAAKNQRVMRSATRIMGIDPGGSGTDGDCTAIVIRYDDIVLPVIRIPSERNEEVPARVAQLAYQHQIDAIFVDHTGGWASHLIPTLSASGWSPIPVNFGSRANNDARFANRRAEMWSTMKDWVETPAAVLPEGDHKLVNEMCSVRYSFGANQKMVLEPKAAVRKRLSNAASPDSADALALTFAMPVISNNHRATPRRMSDTRRNADGSTYWRKTPYREPGGYTEYDPFS